MLTSLRVKNNCEYDIKYVQDRIVTTERNFAELCNAFAQYSRKIARVRDKGDVITESLMSIADNEEISKSLSVGLKSFAADFAGVNDYGNVRVQQVDAKIVTEFSKYENICKQAKEDVKQIFTAQEKELVKRKQCKRVKEKKSSRQIIQQAESDLVRAQMEVMKTVDNVEDKFTTFEKQKLHDFKAILLDFILIEIGYHSKALQQLTKAYRDIDEIDEDYDLKLFREVIELKGMEFKKALKSTESPLSPFKSSQSLGAINTIPKKHVHSPGIPTELRTFHSEETLDISTDTDEDSTITEKSSPKVIKKYFK